MSSGAQGSLGVPALPAALHTGVPAASTLLSAVHRGGELARLAAIKSLSEALSRAASCRESLAPSRDEAVLPPADPQPGATASPSTAHLPAAAPTLPGAFGHWQTLPLHPHFHPTQAPQ